MERYSTQVRLSFLRFLQATIHATLRHRPIRQYLINALFNFYDRRDTVARYTVEREREREREGERGRA